MTLYLPKAAGGFCQTPNKMEEPAFKSRTVPSEKWSEAVLCGSDVLTILNVMF